MEGGRSAIIGAQRGARLMLTSATPTSQHVCGLEQRGSRDDVRLVTASLVTGKGIDEHASDGACRDVSSSLVTNRVATTVVTAAVKLQVPLQLRLCNAQSVATDDMRVRKIPMLTTAELVNEVGFVHW